MSLFRSPRNYRNGTANHNPESSSSICGNAEITDTPKLRPRLVRVSSTREQLSKCLRKSKSLMGVMPSRLTPSTTAPSDLHKLTEIKGRRHSHTTTSRSSFPRCPEACSTPSAMHDGFATILASEWTDRRKAHELIPLFQANGVKRLIFSLDRVILGKVVSGFGLSEQGIRECLDSLSLPWSELARCAQLEGMPFYIVFFSDQKSPYLADNRLYGAELMTALLDLLCERRAEEKLAPEAIVTLPQPRPKTWSDFVDLGNDAIHKPLLNIIRRRYSPNDLQSEFLVFDHNPEEVHRLVSSGWPCIFVKEGPLRLDNDCLELKKPSNQTLSASTKRELR